MWRRYTNWLHTRWPAGRVERQPQVNDDGSTNVPGLYVVGDISGIPLLKFSSHTGAAAVQTIIKDRAFQRRDHDARRDGKTVLDLVIIGAGVSGVAAAIEAKKHGLSFEILEASESLFTIVNFPKGKPIFTYPTDMTPVGDLQFTERSVIKEGLVDELRERMEHHEIEPTIARVDRVARRSGHLDCVVVDDGTVSAHRVIVGIGRSGDFRKLNVSGEELDKVYNRLHDPKDFAGQNVLVVGGGDSALETAIALVGCGAAVTLSYRNSEFNRPKPENVERLRSLQDDAVAPNGVAEASGSWCVTDGGPSSGGSINVMMASRVGQRWIQTNF